MPQLTKKTIVCPPTLKESIGDNLKMKASSQKVEKFSSSNIPLQPNSKSKISAHLKKSVTYH